MERRIDLDRARREAKRRAKESGGKLSDAQLAVARELGEASWPRLVRRVEAEAVARGDRARQPLLDAAHGRRDHAEALLAPDPEVGRPRLRPAPVLREAARAPPRPRGGPGRRGARPRARAGGGGGGAPRGGARPGAPPAPGRPPPVAAAALPLPLRVPRRRAHGRAGRVRPGAARGGRRPG